MGEKYYVEFSTVKNCFHIDTLERIKEVNFELCEKNINNGYVIIGGPVNHQEAREFVYKYYGLKRNKPTFRTRKE